MLNLLLEGSSSLCLINDTTLSDSPNLFPLSSFIYEKSYTIIADCVLEHILTNKGLTNYEKLYYLLADSLSYINSKSTQGQYTDRAADLASEGWAARLKCSRSLIFSMQKSLKEKGYFLIKKEWDKEGRNKRNLIIPTLPTNVFERLNKKFPNRVGEHTPYNHLTECKRSYLDRTKLFIKINYQLLFTVISSLSLNPKEKILWLGFYTKCYKNYMLKAKKNFNLTEINNSNINSSFSFISSYQELAELYSYDTKSLSKSIRTLEKQSFIKTKHFYVRKKGSKGNYNIMPNNKSRMQSNDYYNNNPLQERQDQSLWEIVLSLPTECFLEIEKTRNRSSYSNNVNYKVNSNSSENYLVLGGVRFNLNAEQSLLLKSLSMGSQTDITRIKSKFNVNNEDSNNDIGINVEERVTNLTENKSDPIFAKFRLLLNKDFKLNNKDLENIDSDSPFSQSASNFVSDLSVFYRNSLEKVEIDNKAITNQQEISAINRFIGKVKKEKEKESRGVEGKKVTKQNFFSVTTCPTHKYAKSLKSFYPLSKEQVDKLNYLSDREFSVNFTNQLLLKLHNINPDKKFLSFNHMMSYMSKALRNERHQGPLVNHETFRFTCNLNEQENEDGMIEKYLAEVEYNVDSSYQSQLRRKIAGQLEPKLAYQLLKDGRFNFNNDGNPADQSENILLIELPSSLSLTDKQQESLESAVHGVYGKTQIAYEKTEIISSFQKNQKALERKKRVEKTQCKELDAHNTDLILDEGLSNSNWYKIRKALKEELGESADKTWFSQVIAEEHIVHETLKEERLETTKEARNEGQEGRVQSQMEKSLVLHLPNNFMRDMIKQRFGNKIEQYCKILTPLKFYSYENIITRAENLQLSG